MPVLYISHQKNHLLRAILPLSDVKEGCPGEIQEPICFCSCHPGTGLIDWNLEVSSHMKTLPFRIKKIFEGLAESQGMLKVADETLYLEFQTKDTVFGVIKSDVRQLEIPLDKIRDIQFKKGMFGDKIIIRANDLKTFEEIPNQKGGEIELYLDKKHRHETIMLVSDIQLAQAEAALRQIQEKQI
jgi:hypothetical protein